MNERQLRDRFKQYSFQSWKDILDFVFGKVEYFSSPHNPFAETKKVVDGKQYGRIKLEDNKSIALFEVQVDDTVDIEKNRQGLREIAARHIDQNITHGALVFFHSPSQEKYRFTFIAKWSDINLETGELQKGETQKKRYTYLLGEGESGATAAKRLLELANKKPVITINHVINAFSVEPIKKEFFKKYKEHYERFWRFIDEKPQYQILLIDNEKENEDAKRKPIRDFSKKLLGRIVFLHFLQKKGWMGCPVLPTPQENDEVWENGDPNFMYNLYDGFAQQEHFYSKCLTKLFFRTLNEPKRANNVFSITGTRVPYLNGGLFENDQEGTENIDFPASYFQELLDFFCQYNFTIDENSPDEQEIGIDPEMLGHIFENLLEENREKGAFYTPKEIVHYMCQESLVQYLKNHFPEVANVEAFIRNQQVSDFFRKRENAARLNELLDKVKVCDPAIGSGAFPIGILQEIYLAKRYIYPYLNSILPFDPAETKKKIIQESIYGVDLEHGAVEIARLRFWLALVVDEDKPQPLPNLDYKIMQGNSLLESFEGVDLSQVGTGKKNVAIVEPERDLFGNIKDSQMKMTFTQTETVKEIQNLIKNFFDEKDPLEKAALKNSINQKVHEHIDFNLELRENQLARRIAEAGNGNALNAKAKRKLEELKKEQAEFKQKRERLHKIQNTEEKPYFIWHLFFKDVFDNGGFDIVIGNPPYIQLQKMGKEADVLEEAEFESFARTGDIYCLFYEKGKNILKPRGVLIYITSNKWMSAAYGKNFRKYLMEKTNPLLLIDFSEAVIFPSAVVFVNILLFKNEIFSRKLWTVKAKDDFKVSVTELSTYIASKGVEIDSLNEENWTVVEKEDYEIKLLIEEVGLQLRHWDLNFFRGITSGLNEAYHINETERNNFIKASKKNEELIKPLLRGKDIKRYVYTYAAKYILFIPWHFPLHEDPDISSASTIAEKAFEKDYPEVFYHLKGFQNELEARNASETGIRYEWYALQRYGANFWKEFEKEKIVWIEISDRANFCLDREGHFLTNSAYFLTGGNLKYLLAVLNSDVVDFYHFQNTAQIAGGRKRYTKQYVELLPIPKIDEKRMKPFEIMADYLTFINSPNSPSIIEQKENELLNDDFEDVLNIMVNELYFEEHMKQLEIDVLKFFDFSDISQIADPNQKKGEIVKAWYKLQERDNPIRNRILISDSRSWIIKKINQTVL